jgi:hypothetical protein
MYYLDHFRLEEIDASNLCCQALYDIFCKTLKPEMSFREFRSYYQNEALERIEGFLIKKDGVVIGFCTAAFYHLVVKGKHYVIGRSAVGIIEAERHKRLPVWSLFAKFIIYKRRHPFYRLVMTGYIANPIIYAMLCKYVGIVYPREGQAVSDEILSFKNELLRKSGLLKSERHPFVLRIHFSVKLLAGDVERIMSSVSSHVRYFLQINPLFREQYGVMVIIPVTWYNILLSVYNYVIDRCRKWVRRLAGEARRIQKMV